MVTPFFKSLIATWKKKQLTPKKTLVNEKIFSFVYYFCKKMNICLTFVVFSWHSKIYCLIVTGR